ncbi:MAG: hypothetical protein WCH82_00550 [Mycobacteriaceae bacterium]
MHNLNWWLMALAFLIGLALTLGLMIRKVTREVPITHTVSAGLKAGAAAAGASTFTGAAAARIASIDEVPAGPHGKGSAKAGADGSGPAGWLIKGNADSMLFHGPDSPAYEQTVAEVWFFDEATARQAGFDKWDKNFR